MWKTGDEFQLDMEFFLIGKKYSSMGGNSKSMHFVFELVGSILVCPPKRWNTAQEGLEGKTVNPLGEQVSPEQHTLRSDREQGVSARSSFPQ